MNKWLLRVGEFVFCVFMLITSGCQEQVQEQVEEKTEVAKVTSVPSYANEVIRATGNLETWLNSDLLELEGVVTFYNSDGSYYLTEHSYKIKPWLNEIEISACEPEGRFVWNLQKDSLRVSGGAKFSNPKPDINFARAVLDSMTASVRLLDESFTFDRASEKSKVEGLWYYSIERLTAGESQMESKQVFYLNSETFLIDRIWYDSKREKDFVVRGYDYKAIEKGGVIVPSKVEIFEADSPGRLNRRLATIDFK